MYNLILVKQYITLLAVKTTVILCTLIAKLFCFYQVSHQLTREALMGHRIGSFF